VNQRRGEEPYDIWKSLELLGMWMAWHQMHRWRLLCRMDAPLPPGSLAARALKAIPDKIIMATASFELSTAILSALIMCMYPMVISLVGI
jgi:hypothetical protein